MKVNILGTRGIPAKHGGFETFAEQLSLYLVQRGWSVSVYCQEKGNDKLYCSYWKGVKLIHIPVNLDGPISTIVFDFKSVLHSLKSPGLILTLGYNTAVFSLLYRLKRKTNIINMDGIEWRRQKWSKLAKLWFYINEKFGCWFGNYLVADNPHIANHLAKNVSLNKITMIPYGGWDVQHADGSILTQFGLEKKHFATLIARPEPENSVLELVTAFSSNPRNMKLVVLGKYEPEVNRYHREIKEAASDEVVFLGAIYDPCILEALRFHSRFYVHGHRVGGTNPSLVEAMGAGNAILAHDNKYNRWVTDDKAVFFSDIPSACHGLELLISNDKVLTELQTGSKNTFRKRFTWNSIFMQYEKLLQSQLKH